MIIRHMAITLILLLIIFSGMALAEPQLSIPDAEFNFGYAPQNSTISHVFWLHNTGTDTLKIIKVSPGWGCTKAPLEKEELAVGDSTRLEIIFSTKTYRGKRTKRPSITTNEGPDRKRVEISSDIVTNPDSTYPITVQPYKFNISQFGEKERTKLEFVITNVSNEDLEVKLVDMPQDMFEIKLPKKIKAGKSEKGKIEINDEYVSQEFKKSLTIELNDNAVSRFTIPVERTIRIPGAHSSEHSEK